MMLFVLPSAGQENEVCCLSAQPQLKMSAFLIEGEINSPKDAEAVKRKGVKISLTDLLVSLSVNSFISWPPKLQ